mmetsp:Transcript_27235/g.82699  ORF Transcript_27235/g.82699 Transcript_27235/m.82699 type:complete len:100 (-) Transcript_27235:310-609(-)
MRIHHELARLPVSSTEISLGAPPTGACKTAPWLVPSGDVYFTMCATIVGIAHFQFVGGMRRARPTPSNASLFVHVAYSIVRVHHCCAPFRSLHYGRGHI